MAGARVTLVAFTQAWLDQVRPWFRHREVDRWLGGPEWPERALRLQGTGLGEVYRGLRVLRSYSWVALDEAGAAVGLIGGEVYDRWCRYTEACGEPAVDHVEDGPAMSLAYVVDPGRWRHGYGVAALRAVLGAPEVADVVLFTAGVEDGNAASARCAVRAGFAPDGPEPDWEGIVHHVLRRAVAPPRP